MLQQRDAEAAFMKRLEQKEREFKLKQYAGATEFQRIRRGFAHRRYARLERDRRVGQAILAQRITRGWMGRRYANEVKAWLDECHRCALLRFDPYKSAVPKAKGAIILLHGGNTNGAGLRAALHRASPTAWPAFERRVVDAGCRLVFPDALVGFGELAKEGMAGSWIDAEYFALGARAEAYRPWRRKNDAADSQLSQASALDLLMAARGKSKQQLEAEAKAAAEAAEAARDYEKEEAVMAGLQLRKQQEKIEEIIGDLVTKENVPPHRIVLGGVGAGATVAFTAAMRSKWALRAVFMMGGMLHPSADLFDGPLCRAVPSLLLLHGERDSLVPRKTHRLVLRMLSRATVNADITAAADIVEEVCPGCGHEVSTSYAEEFGSGDPLSRSLAPPDEDAARARAEAAQRKRLRQRRHIRHMHEEHDPEAELAKFEQERVKTLIYWLYRVLAKPLQLTPLSEETEYRGEAKLYTEPSQTYSKFFTECKHSDRTDGDAEHNPVSR